MKLYLLLSLSLSITHTDTCTRTHTQLTIEAISMATKELPDSASAETTVYYITNMLPTRTSPLKPVRSGQILPLIAGKHHHGDKLITEQTWKVRQSIFLTLVVGERMEK